MPTNWDEIVTYYDSCYEKYKDTHLGMDWPTEEGANERYLIMYGLVKDDPHSMLDYGCGTGRFLDRVRAYCDRWPSNPNTYFGYDKNPNVIGYCKKKFPSLYQFSSTEYPESDYVIMNGVFTEKRSIIHAEFWQMMKDELLEVWPETKKGLAFNVMSSHVDYEKDFLFHLPMDKMAEFVSKNMSRKFVIRNDYLPYEYTVYIYR